MVTVECLVGTWQEERAQRSSRLAFWSMTNQTSSSFTLLYCLLHPRCVGPTWVMIELHYNYNWLPAPYILHISFLILHFVAPSSNTECYMRHSLKINRGPFILPQSVAQRNLVTLDQIFFQNQMHFCFFDHAHKHCLIWTISSHLCSQSSLIWPGCNMLLCNMWRDHLS